MPTPMPKHGTKLLTCDTVPDLTQDDVMAMCRAYHASYHREIELQIMQNITRMPFELAKSVHAQMQRICDDVFPPPVHSGPCNENYVAVIMTGSSHFLMQPGILKYWRQVSDSIHQVGRELVVFAVLDERSELPVTRGATRMFHDDDPNAIKEILATVTKQSQEVFLSGDTSVETHASKVSNPQLKDLLTIKNTSDAKLYNDAVQAQFMKWIIGLDMMLNYENSMGSICFSHVIHSRPDFVWMALIEPNLMQAAFHYITDVAYIIHSEAAIMPRRLAGAYFTTFAMQRALDRGNAYAARILHDIVHTAGHGNLLASTSMLAYHGIMFAGEGLDFPGGRLPYAGFNTADTVGFSVWPTQAGFCVNEVVGSSYLNVPRCADSPFKYHQNFEV